MRYLTWKLSWSEDHKYGIGPQQNAAENNIIIYPSMWANPNIENGIILGYLLSGEININSFSNWQLNEISQQDAINFALQIDQNAFLAEDGIILTQIHYF